jgi:membrane associated rhomboid family serine protease
VGVEQQDKPRSPEDDLLGFKARLLMGVLFAALYIGTFMPRQSDVAAILSGVLGGAVVFLLLKEVDERRKRRWRRQNRRD